MARGNDCRIPASSQKVQDTVAEYVSTTEKGLLPSHRSRRVFCFAPWRCDIPQFGKTPAGHPVGLVRNGAEREKRQPNKFREETDIVDALVSLAVLAHVQANVGQHEISDWSG